MPAIRGRRMKYALQIWLGTTQQPSLQHFSDLPFPAFAPGQILTANLPGLLPRQRYQITAVGYGLDDVGIVTRLSVHPWIRSVDAGELFSDGDDFVPWPF